MLILPLLWLTFPAAAAEANAVAKSAKPTLSLTNLVAGQRLSNAVFTVQGTATDKAGVTNVLYSLNQSAWTNASTTSSWTNWSVQIILKPGTNTFSAYAVNTSGTHSTTNTVKFVYVVMSTITVRTNGPGSISPNYEGVPLQLGNNYSLTATSSIAGFGLQTWTDASNNIITNSATVQFVMASNLTFVANMGDVTKPIISVTSVVTNTGGNPTSLIITGTTTDNVAVTNVQYSLNNAAWTNVISANNWSNWTVQVSMVPGTNTVSIQAVDSSGDLATTNAAKIFYLATSVLTVRTNGPGKITPDDNGAILKIGVSYSITAKGTATGFGLVSWTDGDGHFLTNTATLNFLMASNLVLIANMGDVTAPTLDVITTTTNMDGVQNHFVVHGVASDNFGVTNVYYRLNTDAWSPASTTNSWTNWTADVALNPGANKFYFYGVDIHSNTSSVLSAEIDYNSAPTSLAGFSGIVVFGDTNHIAPVNVAFAKKTFSQFAQDTNNVNGVGSYTYVASGGGASLKLKYTGPPSATSEGSQIIGLTFYTPSLAIFTNTTTTDSGYIQFLSVSNLTLTDVSTHSLLSFGRQGDGQGLFFQKGKYVSQSLNTATTNAGKYTYTQYSPVGALLKLTGTNGTDYVLANFAATNLGLFYAEAYDRSGQTNGTDAGLFLVDAQQTNWNAPLTVTNQIMQITSADGSFNENFGLNTFSQDTRSSNYDNDVGNYSYTDAGTNISLLNLTVTEPPTLAGGQSTGWLVFTNPNAGMLLNRDATISSFALTTATNLAPDIFTNYLASLTFDSGGNNDIYFYGGTIYSYNFFFGWQPFGTYTYETFSPGGAMAQLDFNGTGRDWIQFNFNATNAGSFFANEFDASTNLLDTLSGQFNLQ